MEKRASVFHIVLVAPYKREYIPTWLNNHIPSKVLDKISYPFPNFIGRTVEVCGWIINSTLEFKMDAITYPCWD